MNIEVGEYIRTKQGDIDKVILEYTGKCANPNCTKKHISCKLNYYDEEDIVSHSKDIIGLIEVGDYVNGKYVYKNGTDFGGDKCLHMESSEVYACEDFLYEDDIKSIVTRQQFSNMEYRV